MLVSISDEKINSSSLLNWKENCESKLIYIISPWRPNKFNGNVHDVSSQYTSKVRSRSKARMAFSNCATVRNVRGTHLNFTSHTCYPGKHTTWQNGEVNLDIIHKAKTKQECKLKYSPLTYKFLNNSVEVPQISTLTKV